MNRHIEPDRLRLTHHQPKHKQIKIDQVIWMSEGIWGEM